MYGRDVVVANLKQMRRRLEDVQVVPLEWSCLIFDVCLALGVSEGEAQSIIGPAFGVVEETLETSYQEEVEVYYEAPSV